MQYLLGQCGCKSNTYQLLGIRLSKNPSLRRVSTAAGCNWSAWRNKNQVLPQQIRICFSLTVLQCSPGFCSASCASAACTLGNTKIANPLLHCVFEEKILPRMIVGFLRTFWHRLWEHLPHPVTKPVLKCYRIFESLTVNEHAPTWGTPQLGPRYICLHYRDIVLWIWSSTVWWLVPCFWKQLVSR